MDSAIANRPAPLPENEDARLLALQGYCVMDTPPEPVFDNLTALAAALFQVPITLISLVGEHRQFFKSAVGTSARETGRDVSFCSYTVFSYEPLVILDATQDERFCGNALVVGPPHIRFYAGAPLIGRDALCLGSFCVISDQPREAFSPEEQSQLARFAMLAVEALEARLHVERIERTERAVREANERYRLMARATTDGIWDWDIGSGEVYFSPRLRAIMGAEEAEYWGSLEEFVRRLHPADAAAAQANLQHILTTPVPAFESLYRMRHEDGTWRWLHNRATVVRDADGKLLRLLGAVTDVTDRKVRDELTGLSTQVSLLAALEERMASAEPGASQFAVLSLDFEQFQRLNNSLGQRCGDLFLNETAVRLRQSLAVDRGDLAARLVADEFGILLHHVSGVEDALEQAQHLLAIVQAPTTCEKHTLKLTASLGVVLCSPEYTSAEEMLRDAHAAMHEAKAKGGGQVRVFSPDIRERALESVSLESELREALRENKVSLHYQPKIRMDTGELIGFEALMRWHHPERGTISPAVFIGLAEESDLILEIGRWTLLEALRQLAAWRQAGLIGDEITMAVNLSARQFGDEHLIANLRRKLAMFDLPASCLALEVTEGILIMDVARAQHILDQLKELGVGIDLDDFGTGYSSLGYLTRFPFDSLKVDQSFVRDLGTSQEALAIAQAIVGLGKTMNLRVIAEGIETQAQATALQAMGCTYAQGYLFARPLPAEQIQQHLMLRSCWVPEAQPIASLHPTSA